MLCQGCRRYWSPEIKSLLQELTAGQEQRESALKGILMRLVHKFCEDYSIWLSAVKSIAGIILDAVECRASDELPMAMFAIIEFIIYATLQSFQFVISQWMCMESSNPV